MPNLNSCRVVLVRPHIAANIGATARVMRNFGLSDLRLVAPVADPLDEQARKLSTHGESILHSAPIVSDLSQAVGDCLLVIGTSARSGGPFRRQSVVSPASIMPRIVETLPQGPVAFVFGPEPSGLTDAEVSRCHYLISIPTDETYPALNLAQAVAICLYELQKTLKPEAQTKELSSAFSLTVQASILSKKGGAGGLHQPSPTPFDMQEKMFQNLEQALKNLHFLWGDNADSLMHALRHLIGRAQPTPMEIDLLHGLARQINWFVKRSGSS